ncbi:expressed unknown protein [Seminavis robusta]|uniref:Uncharacterized protein n=1 Tax=Seminavis robusta TaxID=568900 RepID=A0A9N8HY11_9STRA|nr:expressed unknown protein [Seminavis robusta]|eukprot:Sro2694_g334850.1 n/a (197) ;mRNA; r:1041-1631
MVSSGASSIVLGLAISAATMGGPAAAFVVGNTPSQPPSVGTSTVMPLMMANNGDDSVESSRKEVLSALGWTAAAWAVSGTLDNKAYAAEEGEAATVVVEESVVSPILQSSNLKSIKKAEKQLSKLEFYAVQNDFEALKVEIRNAPFSEIRKNSFKFIKEYAGQEETQSKLSASYDVFITSLEKMDQRSQKQGQFLV